jgi:hypothetical protein
MGWTDLWCDPYGLVEQVITLMRGEQAAEMVHGGDSARGNDNGGQGFSSARSASPVSADATHGTSEMAPEAPVALRMRALEKALRSQATAAMRELHGLEKMQHRLAAQVGVIVQQMGVEGLAPGVLNSHTDDSQRCCSDRLKHLEVTVQEHGTMIGHMQEVR